jgi:hypothetical protein
MSSAVDKVVAHARCRDFFSQAYALAAFSNGDLEYARSRIDYVNKSHASNMGTLTESLATGSKWIARPSRTACTPIEIVDAFKSARGSIHFKHTVPGTELVGVFPALAA